MQQKNPTNPYYPSLIALSKFQLGKKQEALQDLNKIDPQNPFKYVAYSQLFEASKEYKYGDYSLGIGKFLFPKNIDIIQQQSKVISSLKNKEEEFLVDFALR